MKKLRWQLVIILLTGLVVGVLLIIQQQPVTQTATPAPTQGGIYTEGLIGSFNRLNPLLDLFNSADREVNRLLFSSLVRFDSRGVPHGELAESWGYSQDGTLYNFALRADAKWHDGEPVTTDDVAFTIDLMRSAEGLVPDDLRAFWNDIDVKVLSKTEMQFRLPEGFAPFMDYLTFGVLPQHILGDVAPADIANSGFNLKPVGSGPYRFNRLLVENEQITGVVLDASDDYFGEKPFIEQIVFRYYDSGPDALAAYQAGEIQGIGRVSGDILTQVLAEPGLSIYTGRQPRLALIYFNLKNENATFLQDPALRLALLQGLNRQWMLDNVLRGQAVLANGPILPGTWAYYEDTPVVSFDPAAAKEALSAAGYTVKEEGLTDKDGKLVSFTLLYPDSEQYKAIAEVAQKNWTELGVKVELTPVPYDQLVGERLATHDFEAALVEINLSNTPDPDPYPFWDQGQAAEGQNYGQWNNRTASEYLESARVTVDNAERVRLYKNFQVLFAKEMPALPLYHPVYTFAIDSTVQGVQMGPLFDTSDRFAQVNTWFLVAKRQQEPAASATTTPAKP